MNKLVEPEENNHLLNKAFIIPQVVKKWIFFVKWQKQFITKLVD